MKGPIRGQAINMRSYPQPGNKLTRTNPKGLNPKKEKTDGINLQAENKLTELIRKQERSERLE
jgi:hypothetical protein